jgi:hypothetical protein
MMFSFPKLQIAESLPICQQADEAPVVANVSVILMLALSRLYRQINTASRCNTKVRRYQLHEGSSACLYYFANTPMLKVAVFNS